MQQCVMSRSHAAMCNVTQSCSQCVVNKSKHNKQLTKLKTVDVVFSSFLQFHHNKNNINTYRCESVLSDYSTLLFRWKKSFKNDTLTSTVRNDASSFIVANWL